MQTAVHGPLASLHESLCKMQILKHLSRLSEPESASLDPQRSKGSCISLVLSSMSPRAGPVL